MKKKRSQDIYEQLPFYKKPQLKPFPKKIDYSFLKEAGLKTTPFSLKVIKFFMKLSGLSKFQNEPSDKIEKLLRTKDIRGAYLFAPITAATICIRDDLNKTDPLNRAASLIWAMLNFHKKLYSGQLPQDKFKGEPLEMGQYQNLFGTSIIPEKRKSIFFKSGKTNQLTVIHNGHQFILTFQESQIPSPFEIRRTLNKIVMESKTKNDLPVGTLSYAQHSWQIRNFKKLKKIETNNGASTHLKNSLFTVCLDLNDSPKGYSKTGLLTHAQNTYNRWSHSSLQLIVFRNSKSAIICNFNAHIDGNIMTSFAEKISEVAEKSKIKSCKSKTTISIKKLNWEIEKEVIENASSFHKRLISNQDATFSIKGFGQKYFRKHGLNGVFIFIVALQHTMHQKLGKNLNISQFLSTSKYCCNGVIRALVTNEKLIEFVKELEEKKPNSKKANLLLSEAMNITKEENKVARNQMNLQQMTIYHIMSNHGLKKLYTILVKLLRDVTLNIFHLTESKSYDILVSAPLINPRIPIIGRPGICLPYVKEFGIHYQIWEDKIVITYMPAMNQNQKITNLELTEGIERSLKKIDLVLNNK